MFVPLSTIDFQQDQLFGGKAIGLARLLHHGFRVPPAVVIPTTCFQDFLQRNGLWERAQTGDDELAAAIKKAPFYGVDSASLFASLAQLGSVFVVRSSAVGEDAEDRSFAGQYVTVLQQQLDHNLLLAVKECWASYYSTGALHYRQNTPIVPGGMAVVIQRQIQPIQAGVMFTINPLNGSWREMVIESHPGLGEGVVAASVLPDFYLIKRPRSWPPPFRRLAARLRVKNIHHRSASESPLEPESLLRLGRLGLAIERCFDKPQDIEWALSRDDKIWILQSRPITTTPKTATSEIVWTRQFLGERWTIPATQLGWSEIKELISFFIDYPKTSQSYLGGGECVRLYRNSPYINTEIFRHLLFKLPGAEPVPRFMSELLPAADRQALFKTYALAPQLRVYASVIQETIAEKRWQRFRWNPFSNWKAWDNYLLRLNGFLAKHQNDPKDVADALERVRRIAYMAKEYAKVHVCSLLFADLWHQYSNWKLSLASKENLIPHLLRSPKRTATQRVNQELWELGKGYIQQRDFLRRYGHRSTNSWALFAPRWSEVPEEVQQLASLAAQGQEPAERDKVALDGLAMAMKEIDGGLAILLHRTQRYLFLREEQRFHFERLLWVWKKAWLWLEREKGLALRHLTKAEALACVKGQLSGVSSLIEERRLQWQREQDAWLRGAVPSRFLFGDQPYIENEDKNCYRGTGVSSGIVRGKVRMVHSVAEAQQLQAGEVLVVSTVDPGWTSLFLKASGLVMELGGMLSHGAVVAREYQLPAVAGVGAIMADLENGQMIVLDGLRGMVWIE